MQTILKLKTAQAADVAGVGYEGFRTWLKRGLLKDTGILPKFYASDVPAEIADAKRWRWTAFGYSDLCSFRLAKILLDSGLAWETVNPIVSDRTLWKSHQSDDQAIQYLAIINQGAEYFLCDRKTLATQFSAGTIGDPIMTIIDLDHLHKNVVLRSRAAALRAVATELNQTSHIFARSGSNLLPPQDAAERKDTIEQLAGEVDLLATEAAHGGGSYAKFEEILRQLHTLGKFPESPAVSAVAAAFVLRLGR